MSTYHWQQIQLPINDDIQPNGFPFASNPLHPKNYDYEWILVVGGLFAFFAAWGIGANDVANSFAPSVGAGSLKLWQACIAAAICEFLGALLLGAGVTDTIKGKITNPDEFIGNDDLLMFGMLCADLSTGIWLHTATALEMTVSTTHTVIGAIIGYSLVFAGGRAVNWASLGMIVASWFVSPVLAGIISSSMFWVVRRFILRHPDSFERSLKFYPVLLAVTIWINLSFIFIKAGVSSGKLGDLQVGDLVGIAFAVAIGVGVIANFTVARHFRVKYKDLPEEHPAVTARRARKAAREAAAAQMSRTPLEDVKEEVETEPHAATSENTTEFALENGDTAAETPTEGDVEQGKPQAEDTQSQASQPQQQRTPLDSAPSVAASVSSGSVAKPTSRWGKIQNRLDGAFSSSQQSIHGSLETDAAIGDMHDRAEVFPYRTECVFGLLQVLTACATSFAHGANDVSNAIGPFSTVQAIYTTGSVAGASKVPVQQWILAMGGAGIVLGLAMYGYKIMGALGVKMVKITPSRGFAIELGAAIIIIIGSFVALPLSSTQCVVGATVGVGLVEGRKQVNWKIIGRSFFGWIITVFISGALCATVFSFATYSPSQYYPLSEGNCLAMYGQTYNVSQTGFGGPLSVNLVDGLVKVVGGYPSTGARLDLCGAPNSNPGPCTGSILTT